MNSDKKDIETEVETIKKSVFTVELSLKYKEVDHPIPIDSEQSILTLPVPKTYEDIFAECHESFKNIDQYLASANYYPQREHIFRALHETPLDKVRVIILGLDPYPQTFDGSHCYANGLAFATNAPDIPLSLQNIYKELQRSYTTFVIPKHGNLTPWCKQGVLLLNASLTVEEKKPKSHAKIWYHLITEIITKVTEIRKSPIIVFWGRDVENLEEYASNSTIRLKSNHPASENRKTRKSAQPPKKIKNAFHGNNHFKLINDHLRKLGEEEINWALIGTGKT